MKSCHLFEGFLSALLKTSTAVLPLSVYKFKNSSTGIRIKLLVVEAFQFKGALLC